MPTYYTRVEEENEMTSEWTVEPVENMPGKPNGRRNQTSLTAAVRALKPGQAIFVSCKPGEVPVTAMNRVGTSRRGMRDVHTRQDRERNGVWIYREPEKA